ncbi:hypothetical protein BC831DRAFT_456019 [Entophlyctis helioformis]|nr:hypothetical protein BC831DRAFT_456019 [Entophlyctis helioformis]
MPKRPGHIGQLDPVASDHLSALPAPGTTTTRLTSNKKTLPPLAGETTHLPSPPVGVDADPLAAQIGQLLAGPDTQGNTKYRMGSKKQAPRHLAPMGGGNGAGGGAGGGNGSGAAIAPSASTAVSRATTVQMSSNEPPSAASATPTPTTATAAAVPVPETPVLAEPAASPLALQLQLPPAADKTNPDDAETLKQQLADRDAEIESLKAQLAAKDAEIQELKSESDLARRVDELVARNADLEAEIKALKDAKTSLQSLPSSSKPLSHMTKGRVGPRSASKKPAEEGGSADALAGEAVPSDAAPASVPETAATEPEADPQEVLRKKILGMGGMNPLMPMGFKPGSIKLRSSSGTSLVDDDVRAWLFSVLQDDEFAPDSGTSVKEALRDGKLLCKFPIMHMENINGFLGIAESLGVPKQQLFQPNDLYEAADVPRVLQTLDALRKIVEAKKAAAA